MRGRLPVKRLLVLFLLGLSPVWLPGGWLAPLSIEELTARAEWIVLGTVQSKTCQRDAAGRIYTAVELRIDEVWKGADLAAGQTVRLVHSGGTLGEERVAVSGQVAYEVNEEVVVFLRRNARGEGVTIGLAQGKFHVAPDAATGAKLARRAFAQIKAGPDASDGSGAPITSPALAGASSPGPADAATEPSTGCTDCLTLDELKRQVQRNLTIQ